MVPHTFAFPAEPNLILRHPSKNHAANCFYSIHTALTVRPNPRAPAVRNVQGGPGSSSIDLGLYTEMGYFQTDDQGEHTNPYAWNQVASMLYLESPAGYVCR